jgi:phosphoenolpyruvate-protein phosphotransferase/dihydroxyacetone kinase phosphotransfer subunit
VVGIVVVSHSRALADAAVALASQMLSADRRVPIEVAAGADETAFGTDAERIVTALTAADAASDGDGVVVLMDLGSAVLSAELALELLDDEVRGRVQLCPAPMVEGLVVAAVSAAGGASRAEVAAEAAGALAGKQAQLGPGPGSAPAEDDPGASAGPDQSAPQAASPAVGPAVGSFTVVNPHGLHARPAAIFAAKARAYRDAEISVRNRSTRSDWVPAGSMSKVATLGALAGHELELRVEGAGARTALDELLALGTSGFGEPSAPAPSSVERRTEGPAAPAKRATAEPAAPAKRATAEPAAPAERAAGRPTAPAEPATGRPTTPAESGGELGTASTGGPIPASPGVGIGPARPLRPASPVTASREPAGDPGEEWRRLTEAITLARQTIGRVRQRAAERVGAAEAAIFDAHLALLDDPELLDAARRRIDAGEAATSAWAAAVTEAHDALAALPDEYLRARAADVYAVGDQVSAALTGATVDTADVDGVLVAADLTPAQVTELDSDRVVAVVLANGSPTAHATILLRALGTPAVVAAGPGVLDIPEGTPLAVDGDRGELVVDPDEPTRRRLRDRAEAVATRARWAREHADEPAATRDGVPVVVAANVGSVADARLAGENGADGSGLVRTEFVFLDRDTAPDAAEQEARYRAIAAALGGRRITLRTLDVGGDKPLRYLPMPAEANPFLGLRGIRLVLARPELLAEQLLAVVRVAHDTPVDLMFPMVATLDELLAARRMLAEAGARVGRGEPPGLRVGIMVEVPATALKAAVFAPHVDFFSIGTNDLTQYALAAERGNDAVAALGDPLDPGVLRLIKEVGTAGAAGAVAGPLVGVCGELAADERAVPLLLGLGVRELSVHPRAVPGVKEAVRAVDLAAARELASRAVAADSAAAVRALLPDPIRR